MGRYVDLTGMKFGRLTVIEQAGRTPSGAIRWRCKCECGGEATPTTQALKSGHAKSCGCYRRERIAEGTTKHGGSHSKLYTVWQGMKRRCNNKNFKYYEWYGERGIRVCDEWMNDFSAFRDWALSSGYEEGLTLDRIDCDGDYEPSNCRWVTMYEQDRNKSSNVMVSYHGETACLKDMCRKLNFSTAIARHRMKKHGVTFEQAVDDYDTKPPFVDYNERYRLASA